MAGFGVNVFDAFVDNAADRVVNNFIPGNGVFQTGVDQWLNNDINRHLGGGLGSTYGYGYDNGFGGGGFGGGYGGGWY
ncbi:unnamed protein product [Adineta steineri]|uniref:Uncharacterized protein n=1 Tax=Adineta steineri TaxID=433720 RepID=A0A815NSL5_9BILA|nr:unnamed protein product [Adineta steineri]CAF3569956.1 unnamed protein product [Adineta steineri]